MSVILNSHSEIYCGPEDSLLLPWEFSLPDIATNYGYDTATLTEKARRFASRVEFFEYLMRDQKQRHKVSRFAAKQPQYALCLRDLFECFPSARFIYLCRDGRDVAISLRKNERHMGFMPRVTHDESGMVSMKYCAEAWRLYVNAFSAFENDRRCKYVRYEELCTQPRDVLDDLCSFLGVPFQESMLAFQNGAEGRNDLDSPHLSKVKSALDSNHIGLWKHELTIEQVREFEKYAGAELLHAGYGLSTSVAVDRRESVTSQ